VPITPYLLRDKELRALIHIINTIHNRPQQTLETIIMTRVFALAGQSKVRCITQWRFAKAGTKTHPQRGAALDRNGLSVSTKTACRFEPKSPVGNSEICNETPTGAAGGTLYAALTAYLGLDQFEAMMRALVAAKRISRRGDRYFPIRATAGAASPDAAPPLGKG
jgi:hypothetical protein